jgi:NitT/TauT family transport system substrate-binding protein
MAWVAALLAGVNIVHAATTLNVGYIPILSQSQLFVMQGEGWTREAGLNLKLIVFEEGPSIVKAFQSGKVDVAYFGIGPALVARGSGTDIRVVAANMVEHVALLARGDLARYLLRDAQQGIARFTTKLGRKPRIGTFPPGSVPDTVLRYWLLKVAQLPLDSIDIVPMGAPRLQQALLAGEIDGASALEPILSVVQASDRSAAVVLTGKDMMPNQPGAVLAVSGALVRKNPEAVRKLVELHHRATEFLIMDPDRAAADVSKVLGKKAGDLDLIEKAITSRYAKFVSDPYRIMESTQVMHDFQRESGILAKAVPLDKLFATEFYDAIGGRH